MTSKKSKKELEKTKRIEVYICAKCGSCFFDDKPAAEWCFESGCERK